ncbi:unnamed protein product [Gadus morhua 'NCC']
MTCITYVYSSIKHIIAILIIPNIRRLLRQDPIIKPLQHLLRTSHSPSPRPSGPPQPSGGQGVRTAALKTYTLLGSGLSLVISLLFAGFLVSASDAGVGVTSLWIISSSCSSEYIDMKLLTGLLLLVFGHGVSSVLHSLHYFYTASSGLSTFPEFVAVGMVDGVQIDYYDSNTQREVLKQDWMEQSSAGTATTWRGTLGSSQGSQQTFKADIGF